MKTKMVSIEIVRVVDVVLSIPYQGIQIETGIEALNSHWDWKFNFTRL
jgi:hypothetical protein